MSLLENHELNNNIQDSFSYRKDEKHPDESAQEKLTAINLPLNRSMNATPALTTEQTEASLEALAS